MMTMVRLTVPTEEFALADTFASVPDVEFEAVRFVTHATDRVLPLLWASNADIDAVIDSLAEDDSTADSSVVVNRSGDALFRIHWTDRVQALMDSLVAEGGALVGASGTHAGWTLRVMFPDRAAIAPTREACAEYDVTIERITDLSDGASIAGNHLTDEQYNTVRHAVETGYYDVPRGTELTDLASSSSVSHQALSERLRRGHRALIESVVLR